MKDKSVTKNYIYNLSYQILVLIVPLITTPYVSRVLGAENIGIYSYTTSIVTYFILLGSLGISMYAQREIAYVQDKKIRKSKIFWEIIFLKVITMTITLFIYYFVCIKGTQYQIYYKILVLELVSNCIDIAWFFQGMEEFKKTVARNILIKLISVVSIFIFVRSQDDLINYFIIYVISNLLGNITLWLYLPKYIVKIRMRSLRILKHLKPTILLFIPQIAVQLYVVLDKVMLGIIISDKSEVAYYEQSQKIVKLLLTIITSLGTVMIPRIANNFIKGEKGKVKEYLSKSFNFVLFLSIPMIIGIIIISDKFVPIFFGAGYEEVSLLMKVISPIILIIGLSNVIGSQYLLPTKRQKEYTISVVIGALVNFLLNIMLIKSLKSLGASIATVIAEISVTAIQIYYIRKEFKISELIKKSRNYIIASIIMLCVCILLGYVLRNRISNLFVLLLQVFAGIITYIGLNITFKDEFVIYLKNKIKNFYKRKYEEKI